MTTAERIPLFDRWAAEYDETVSRGEGFPFAGYDDVLATIVRQAEVRPVMSVLDIGTGTGNLALRFAALGCTVTGVDFSPEMLVIARRKVESGTFVEADLCGARPAALQRRFDRIVGAYVLHEFDLLTKVRLLQGLARDCLSPGGRMVVGDVGFATAGARTDAAQRYADRWDASEHYWAADEAIDAMAQAGLRASYAQASPCAGVFTIEAARPDGQA
jgi:putative AdoMet-dependent methyltransferase